MQLKMLEKPKSFEDIQILCKDGTHVTGEDCINCGECINDSSSNAIMVKSILQAFLNNEGTSRYNIGNYDVGFRVTGILSTDCIRYFVMNLFHPIKPRFKMHDIYIMTRGHSYHALLQSGFEEDMVETKVSVDGEAHGLKWILNGSMDGKFYSKVGDVFDNDKGISVLTKIDIKTTEYPPSMRGNKPTKKHVKQLSLYDDMEIAMGLDEADKLELIYVVIGFMATDTDTLVDYFEPLRATKEAGILNEQIKKIENILYYVKRTLEEDKLVLPKISVGTRCSGCIYKTVCKPKVYK